MSNNTTVPAVFVSHDRCLGYGRTGRAAPHKYGWAFFPDGEIGRSISCLEEELFFPQAPAALDVSTASGFEVFRSAYVDAEIKHHAALGRAAAQTLMTVRYNYSIPLRECRIFFPWGGESVLSHCLPAGWRTADPLSGEWVLSSFLEDQRSETGVATFQYCPAPAPAPEEPIFAMTNRKLLEKIHGTLVKAAEQKRVAKLRRGLQHMRDFAPACYDTGGPGREMVDAVSDLVRHLFGPEPK